MRSGHHPHLILGDTWPSPIFPRAGVEVDERQDVGMRDCHQVLMLAKPGAGTTGNSHWSLA